MTDPDRMIDTESMRDAEEQYELVLRESNGDRAKLDKLRRDRDTIIRMMYVESKIGFSFIRSYNDIIRDLELISKKKFKDLSRSIRAYGLRLKFDDEYNYIDNSREIRNKIYDFYQELKLENEDFYDQFLESHRGKTITLYRGVKSNPVYRPDNWNIGDKISQIVPMSTSINLIGPFSVGLGAHDDEKDIIIVFSVDVDENFFALAPELRPYEVSRSDMYAGPPINDYEITLPPGSFIVNGKDMIDNIVIIFAKYEIYTVDEWIREFNTVFPEKPFYQ